MCETVLYPTIDLCKTGQKIEHLRKERGISVKEMQLYFGFENPQAIYKWQWGKSLPSVDNLFALARLLGVPMQEILVETSDQDVVVYGAFLEKQKMGVSANVRCDTHFFQLGHKGLQLCGGKFRLRLPGERVKRPEGESGVEPQLCAEVFGHRHELPEVFRGGNHCQAAEGGGITGGCQLSQAGVSPAAVGADHRPFGCQGKHPAAAGVGAFLFHGSPFLSCRADSILYFILPAGFHHTVGHKHDVPPL